jgi:8-oxo-dGTP diphosphatase
MSKYTYDYPRPALTVDIVLFRFSNDKLQVLLIQRKHDPFAGMWATPGGFVDEDETAEQAAIRELWEETGVHNIRLGQLFADTELNRDPRGWIISVVFFAPVPVETPFKAGDDAQHAEWHHVLSPPNVVFGHEQFIVKAFDKCRFQLQNSVFGKELLPDEFELKTLYKLYLQIINVPEQIEKIVKRLINYSVLIQIGEKWHFEKGRYEAVLIGGFLR